MYQLLLLPSLFLLAAQMDADSLPSHSPPLLSGIDDTHHQSLISRFVRQASRRVCDEVDKDMTVDEVIRTCLYIYISDYNFTVKNVNIAEWDDFTANLNGIHDVTMEINGSPITLMDFPKLRWLYPFVLIVTNNPELVSISVRDEAYIYVRGGITITKNDKLEKLNFGQLTSQKANVPLMIIKQNEKLKTFDGLDRFYETDLVVRGNPSLDNAVVLKLQQLPNPKNKARDIQEFGECIFDEEIVDLTDLEICKLVGGDLKLAKGAKGSAGSTVLSKVIGNVYLTDPKEEDLGILSETNVTGSVVCRFDSEVTNLGQLQFCKLVEGDLKLAKGVNGSAENAVLSSVNGSVYLAGAKEEQLEFLTGTTVTGDINSWCLDSLHGVKIVKTGPCPSPLTTPSPSKSGAHGISGIGGDGILESEWFIASMSAAGVLVLVIGGVLLYFCYFKKKPMDMPLPLDVTQQDSEIMAPEPVRKAPVEHLPLELTAIETVYDAIPMSMPQLERLFGLVQEILDVNPMEFLKAVRYLMYTSYLPSLSDCLGVKMSERYASLDEMYGRWSPAFEVVPVDKVEQGMENNKVSAEKEAQKLWDAILGAPEGKKLAVCLWSHDDLDSAFHLLSPFFTAETIEERKRIEAEHEKEEEAKAEQAKKKEKEAKAAKKKKRKSAGGAEKAVWKKADAKKNKWKKREKAGAGPNEQKTQKRQLSGEKASSEDVKKPGVRHNFPVGNVRNYLEYLGKKYEPAGKMDEGMVTVFPFYVLKEFKKPEGDSTWTREQLSFVVASAWMARALGEDKHLTFRVLHWAKKQRQAKVYVLCDKAEHQEDNALIAQCLYDHVMDTENNDQITFLGACRLICSQKKRSWDNGNMLLFLQRNILHWAIEAGVLRANDKRFVNWDNIYRCMLLRSQATPATKVYDPDNLPCPKDLWSIPYEGNEGKLAPVYTNDYEPKTPNGIWRCDLGAALPKPRTMAGYLGAPEPARYIDKPIGFEAAWGAGALFDGGEQVDSTLDSGLLSGTGTGKSSKAPKNKAVDKDIFKRIADDAQYVMATSANAKKNKWTKPLRLPKRLKPEQGTSERERRNMNAAKGSGKEFEGYRLGSDIDHFCYQATMEFSEYIRPQARPHQWAREDVSQRLDKNKSRNKSKSRNQKKTASDKKM